MSIMNHNGKKFNNRVYKLRQKEASRVFAPLLF